MKSHYSFLYCIAFALLMQGCLSESPGQTGSQSPDHKPWTKLLKKHVDDEGFVDYRGFLADSAELDLYLQDLQQNAPDKSSWSEDERLAYWINAYNAFTVKLIIDHYPVESIKDIGSAIQIPFVNSPWDIKFIEIGDKKLDLNNIEHSILRKEFDEPRIHFAINCASISCPKLRNEAYLASKLSEQLEEQAHSFINDPVRNRIHSTEGEVSQIFSWFRSDFTKGGTLQDFLNRYSEVKLKDNAEITFMDYDWSLNDAP